jgi:peroxiredoxin
MKSRTRILLYGLLAVSLIINTLQFRRILALENDIGERSASGGLRAGTRVPTEFRARGRDGLETSIRFDSTALPTVLYVFRPTCPWCRRNKDAINALARQTAGRYRILGISLSNDGLAKFAEEHHFQFPVYSDIPPSVVDAMKLGTTPETIVVSPSATVLKDWTGAYAGEQKLLAEDFFSVRLPQVTD